MKIREEMYGNGWPFEVGTMWDLLRNNVQCRSEANCMSPMWPFVLSSLYNNSSERSSFEKAVFSRKASSALSASSLQRNRIFEDCSFQICVLRTSRK